MPMNQLEKAICQSVKKAHRRYEDITGNWLFHAPEHFLQNYIFISLGKTHEVYAEATRQKIAEGFGRPPRGRPPNKRTYRYDLAVWHRSPHAVEPLRAVIEVKRSWALNQPLRNDAKRISAALKGAQRSKSAYLVIYSEIRGDNAEKKLLAKFRSWANQLGLLLLNTSEKGVTIAKDGEWICGFALMRACAVPNL